MTIALDPPRSAAKREALVTIQGTVAIANRCGMGEKFISNGMGVQ